MKRNGVIVFILMCLLGVACQTNPQPAVNGKLSLSLSSEQIVLTQGQVTSISVSLETETVNEAVTINVADLPEGLSVDRNSLQLTTNEGALQFSANEKATTGNYQVTVTATAGTLSDSKPLNVTVLAKAEPKLANVSAESLSLQAQLSETALGSVSFQNAGNSSLTFSVESDASWLSVKQAAGELNPQESFKLDIEATCNDIIEPQNGKLSLSSNGGNASILVSLNCTEAAPRAGSLILAITGLPEGTEVNVTISSDSFSQTLTSSETLEGLEPSSYTLNAAMVKQGSTTYLPSPETQSVMVSAGGSSSATVVYSKQESDKGSLNLSISGLKEGVAANLSLIGPDGTIPLSSSQLITGLPVGEYGLKAEATTPDSATFSPDTKAQVIFIRANETSIASVGYSCTEVNPPDAVLKAALLNELMDEFGKNPNTAITCDDLAQFEYLNLYAPEDAIEAEKIQNLEGLQYARNLEDLDLSRNALKSLPLYVLSQMPHLEDLELENNQLTRAGLPDAIFSNNTKLKRLDLNNNNFAELPASLFSGLINLFKIDLSYNMLESLPEDLLRDQTKLERLDLGGNDFQTLPEKLFANTASLSSLRLNNNRLNNLPANIFKPLKNLHNLSLNNNQLHSFPEGLFDNLTQLSTLNLNNNLLDNTLYNDKSITKLKMLSTLDLRNNQLTLISDNVFQGLDNLKTLYLSDNAISIISSDAFLSLDGLINLFLSDNQLESLPNNLFEPMRATLDNLNLSTNDLCCFSDSTIFRLDKLRTLNLSYNPRIRTIDDALVEVGTLRNLYLKGNNITNITNLWSFKSSQDNLIFVDLTDNCFYPNAVPNKGYLSAVASYDINVSTTGPRTDCQLNNPPDILEGFSGRYEDRMDWKIIDGGIVGEAEWPFDGESDDFITFSGELFTGPFWYFKAPDYLYGDASAYFGYGITVRIRSEANDYVINSDSSDVILKGAGMTLTSNWYFRPEEPDNLSPIGTDWTVVLMSLKIDNESGQWMKGDVAATNDDLKLVLANLEELLIRGEYSAGFGSDLDRFIMFGSN